MANKKGSTIKKEVSVKEPFISLSGKKYDSLEDYLNTKFKRGNTKFTLFVKAVIKEAEALLRSKKSRVTIIIKDVIDGLNPKKDSPKVLYVADNLITNRKKGFLRYFSVASSIKDGGEKLKIENPVRKIFPKGDKSNGEVEGIYKFDLVKSKVA